MEYPERKAKVIPYSYKMGECLVCHNASELGTGFCPYCKTEYLIDAELEMLSKEKINLEDSLSKAKERLSEAEQYIIDFLNDPVWQSNLDYRKKQIQHYESQLSL